MSKAKRVTVRIDKAHSVKLISGETIAIKVPKGTEVLQLELAESRNYVAEWMDVFFNGRKAR